MSKKYFDLSNEERSDLLNYAAKELGRRPEILEKDIWLCFVLGKLFDLDLAKPMAFKGGTSLSKVYGVIDRFSEDIDVTIDYAGLIPDATLTGMSNSQNKKLSERLKSSLNDYVRNDLMPKLEEVLSNALPNEFIEFSLSPDAEKLLIYYTSAIGNNGPYVNSNILIEFGGRNTTIPQNIFTITPDVAECLKMIDFPVASVSVLSASRTFWEKATLIHVECHRPDVKINANRMARHWYDLAMLANHEIGVSAVSDGFLLLDVLNIKETFFKSSYSNYDKCCSGNFKIVPEGALLDALKADYAEMVKSEMFYGEILSFDDIVKTLSILELSINQSMPFLLASINEDLIVKIKDAANKFGYSSNEHNRLCDMSNRIQNYLSLEVTHSLG